MATCKGTTKAGQPCKAEALAGGDFCFFHDPDKVKERKAARTKGGQAGKLATLADVKPWRVNRAKTGEVVVFEEVTSIEIVKLLADTIDEVKTGEIDAKVANATGYLAGIILKAIQYEAFEERLAAIEEAVGVKK